MEPGFFDATLEMVESPEAMDVLFDCLNERGITITHHELDTQCRPGRTTYRLFVSGGSIEPGKMHIVTFTKHEDEQITAEIEVL